MTSRKGLSKKLILIKPVYEGLLLLWRKDQKIRTSFPHMYLANFTKLFFFADESIFRFVLIT